jgi:ABC-2 type transport system ATP-binding protein
MRAGKYERGLNHLRLVPDESFLIGYLTPEYFYFIGDLRGQNKADVDYC